MNEEFAGGGIVNDFQELLDLVHARIAFIDHRYVNVAQSGSLYTLWDGGLPNGYSPMKKQGAIILGSGGDCCKPGGGANLSAGTFYEGAMVSGYPSDATDNAVQANIVSAGYR